ncbi:copper amine oxidase N-terminal domain-containing protein [Cohnella suwonensis]|uniref:Copper amine oxidase N-terminal domain-containing protein n=1 Tax=Cohnella suwonensis TaxID=696072 RepID=A0ABW0LXH9_9BACL
MIDGREKFFPYPPQLVNGSVFIPFRNLFEALGATVRWDGKSRTVEALKGKRKVRLTIGKSTAEVNGKAVKIAQTPFVKNGATFIPLRLAGEALGYVVVWENATRTIQIVSS